MVKQNRKGVLKTAIAEFLYNYTLIVSALFGVLGSMLGTFVGVWFGAMWFFFRQGFSEGFAKGCLHSIDAMEYLKYRKLAQDYKKDKKSGSKESDRDQNN